MNLFPPSGSEFGVSVGDNGFRETVKSNNFADEYPRQFNGGRARANWDEMDHRGESADDDP
jgi:hypothetical protein